MLFITIIFFTATSDTACYKKFYKVVVSDTIHIGAAFLKLNIVDSIGRQKSILTPNYTSYAFFKINYQMSYECYREFMVGVLNSNEPLSYSSYPDLPGHVTLIENKYVERIARSDKNKFINHFFERKLFKF